MIRWRVVVFLGLFWKSILLFWGFVGMQGLEGRLHRLFYCWVRFVIFRKNFVPEGWFVLPKCWCVERALIARFEKFYYIVFC